MEFTPESQHYLTVNTHKGLCAYQHWFLHLPFFSQLWIRYYKVWIMCAVILMTSWSELNLLLSRRWGRPIVGITEAPSPNNVAELCSYLGSLHCQSFYQLLYELLHKGAKTGVWISIWAQQIWTHGWKSICSIWWEEEVDSSLWCFSIQHRCCYFTCNGWWTRMFHCFCLKNTHKEQKNSQIEKEGVGIVYRVQKFHKYQYGRRFHLPTDHKPLVTILGPIMVAARLQQ